MSDDFITRYYEGEMCPECGDDEGLVKARISALKRERKELRK